MLALLVAGLSWSLTTSARASDGRQVIVAGVERAAAQARGAAAPQAAGAALLLDTRWAAGERPAEDPATAQGLPEAALAPAVDVLTRPVVSVPAPVGPRMARAEVETIIRAAAARWGADPEQLLRVAWCESRHDPRAYNPSHGDSGLFQFIPTTWAKNAPRAGYAGVSPFDPVANANTAAMLFASNKAWMWTCK